MDNNLKLTPLDISHKESFLNFSDQFIGKNYFNESNFQEQVDLSCKNGLNCSFVLIDNKNIIAGIRLTYAPGQWLNKIKTRYIQEQNLDLNSVAYFKSLFINPNYQKQGLGPKLSNQSIKVLQKMNATHILSHSWKESPNNSSVKYLQKQNFKALGEIKNYWQEVDYLCSGCQLRPCICTSIEMLYTI